MKVLEKILETTNLNLNKPELHEQADVTVFNENFDNLDTKIKEIEDKQLEIDSSLEDVVKDNQLESIKQSIMEELDLHYFKKEDMAEIQRYIETTLAETYVTKEKLEQVKQEILNQITNQYLTKTEAQNLYASKTEVNNLKQSVSNGKQKVVDAIIHKGYQASITDSFQSLVNKIAGIKNYGNNLKFKEHRYVEYKSQSQDTIEEITCENGGVAIFLGLGISYSNGAATSSYYVTVDDGEEIVFTENSKMYPFAPKAILKLLDQKNSASGGYQLTNSMEFSKKLKIRLSKNMSSSGYFVVIVLENKEKKNIDSRVKKHEMFLNEDGTKTEIEIFTIKGKGHFRPIALTSGKSQKVKVYSDGILAYDSEMFYNFFYMEKADINSPSTYLKIFQAYIYQIDSIYYDKELKVEIQGHEYTSSNKATFLYQNTIL